MYIQGPIKIDSVATIPWKNGGGTTRELAVAPANATADDFLWRVSIAQINAPGSFSVFSAIDRTILLWHGDGVTLRSPSWPDHKLDDPLLPYEFRGEDEVACDLLGGLTEDLNLMVRRSQVEATFQIIRSEQYAVPECDDFILLCAAGSARLVASGGSHAVEIRSNHFLRASNISQHQAMVIPQDGALLIAILIVRSSNLW